MGTRLATSVHQRRHNQMEQGPTEPHAGRSTFLLSSGGAGGGYYRVVIETGPIPTENQFPCRTLVTCLVGTPLDPPPPPPSGQNHPHQAHRQQQGAPLSQDLPPQGEGGGRERRTHSHSPSPAPSSTPSLQQHAPPPPNAPQGRKNGEGGAWGKGRTKEGNRTGQTAQNDNKERENGKESLWVLEAPVRNMIPQMHTAARSSQCWSRQTPAWTRRVRLDAPGQWHGQPPRLRDGRPPE